MTRLSVLGHALLGLLSSGEMTGYELTREFDVSLANVWSAKHSQIYPELAKLQSDGLIRQTDAGPRGSKRYAATDEGREELRRWLSEPPESETLRSERLLRVFFLGAVPPGAAAAYLHEQSALHRKKLAAYEALAERMPANAEHRWNRVALEAGIRFERAMVDWAEWAESETRRVASPTNDD
jgi:DNA-binding PadR family transcriptional regulator